MEPLLDIFPDPDVLLALEPEELAAQLLPLLCRDPTKQKQFSPTNLGHDLQRAVNHRPAYVGRYGEVSLVLSEALAWIEVQGLAVPAEGIPGSNGWLRLSRKAQKLEAPADLAKFAMARKLPRDLLHPKLQQAVWMAFMRGEYDVAVFLAMKAVEVTVRDATNYPGELGVKLMRKAFDPASGSLTDMNTEHGEREACSALFAGAIGSFKNPHSHRDVQLIDPGEATEIIMLASHLLRIVYSRKQPI